MKRAIPLIVFYAFWLSLAVIVIFSIIPGGSSELSKEKIGIIRKDYFFHALAYAGLSFLYWLSVSSPKPVLKNSPLLYGTLLLILAASLPEFLQMIIPYRRFNWFDMSANGIGLIIGALLFTFYHSILKLSLPRTSP